MAIEDDLPCPCCGYLVFDGTLYKTARDEICPVCFWQCDPVCQMHPFISIRPNKVSLFEAQRNFTKFGAKEERHIGRTRPPHKHEGRAPGWRMLDPAIDNLPEPENRRDYHVNYWVSRPAKS